MGQLCHGPSCAGILCQGYLVRQIQENTRLFGCKTPFKIYQLMGFPFEFEKKGPRVSLI